MNKSAFGLNSTMMCSTKYNCNWSYKVSGGAESKLLYILFFLTSLFIIPWLVPFFWIPVAWFMDGVLVLLTGLYRKDAKLRKTGWWLLSVGLATFFLLDWVKDFKFANPGFALRNTVITIGSGMVTAAYLRQTQNSSCGAHGSQGKIIYFVYFTVVNAWLYLLHIGSDFFIARVPRGFYYEFYKTAYISVVDFAVGYAVCSIPRIDGKTIRRFRTILYACGILPAVWIDVTLPVLRFFYDPEFRSLPAAVSLVALNGLVVLAVREVVMAIRMRS